MTKRPLLFCLAAITLISLALAATDAVAILTRPLAPWFAWMLP